MDRLRSRSTLAPVLSEYGMTQSEYSTPKRRSPQHEKTKQGSSPKSERRKIKQYVIVDKDDSKAEEKKRYYLQVYRDMQRGRQICYNEYMDKMRDKVDKQREQIKKKTQEIEDKLIAQEEREKEESHRVRRRLQRVELDHNDNFLSSIPKSNSYMTLRVVQKLEAEGQIRSHADREEFWESIKQPGVLNYYYNKYFPQAVSQHSSNKSIESYSISHSVGTRSRTSSTSSQAQPEREVKGPPVDFRPMTGIEEVKESSRPTTRDDGGVTQTAEPQPVFRTPSPKRKLDPSIIAKMAAAELDRKYPQQELPELYCMSMDFGPKPPDHEEMLVQMETRRREKERKLFVKRLRRMYQLSQTHGASAQRILNKHEASEELFLEGPALNELLAVDRLMSPEEDVKPRKVSHLPEPKPWERHLGIRRQIVPIQEESEATSTSRTVRSCNSLYRRQDSAKSAGSSASSSQSQEDNAAPPALSLHGVREHSNIVEAKCLSTLWTNYLGAGKSAFAPS